MQLVVQTAAAALGFAVGGPVGAQIGLVAGGIGFNALKGPEKVSQLGPRIEGARISGVAYGAGIPHVMGHPRVGGQLVWNSVIRTISHTTVTEQGSKGGGGVETTSTTYTYEVDLLFILSSNERPGVTRDFRNGALVYSALPDASEATLEASANSPHWLRREVYTGAADQLPDPVYQAAIIAKYGKDLAVAYRHQLGIFYESFNLGDSPQLPNMTWEVGESAIFVDADVLLLVDVATHADHADHSLYECAETLVGTPSITGDYVRVGDVGGIHYANTEFNTLTGRGLTIEAKLKVSTMALGNESTLFFFTRNDNSSFSSRTWFTITRGIFPGVDYGYKILVWNSAAVAAFSTNAITPNVEFDFAWVQANADTNGAQRIYINGALEASWSASGTPAGDVAQEYKIVLGAYAGTTAQTVEFKQFRVKRGENITGSSYTPPTVLDQYGYSAEFDGLGLALVAAEDAYAEVFEELAGMTSDQYDVSDMAGVTRQLRSIAIPPGPPRAALEYFHILFNAYSFATDKVYVRRRGQASVATLTHDELGAYDDGGEAPPALEFTMQPDSEIPAYQGVRFLDTETDYNTALEMSDRHLTAKTGTVNIIDLPLGLLKFEGKQIAETLALDREFAAVTTRLSLAATRGVLEPGDRVAVPDAAGTLYALMLGDKTDSYPRFEFPARLDDPHVFGVEGVTVDENGNAVDLSPIADSIIDLIDGPLVLDEHDRPGFLVAAKGDGVPYGGTIVLRSVDDVVLTRVASVAESALSGDCTTTLGDWSGGHVFDEMNSVTVDFGEGAAESSTYDAIIGDRSINLFAIGVDGRWEYVQARTSTLISPNVCKLTGLVRGLFGTEHNMVDHTSGERCIQIRAAGLRRIEMSNAEIGAERYYRGVTVGRPEDSAISETFTYNAVNLTPLAPVYAIGARDGSDNLTVTFCRRTRLASRLLSTVGASVPLGEESEAYEIDVYTDDTFTTLARAADDPLLATSETFEYSAADQTTDGLTPGDPVAVKIYQISAAIGRGFPLEAVL